MCGFVGYLGNRSLRELDKHFTKIQHRGPDKTEFEEFKNKLTLKSKARAVLWFHRLAINGLDEKSGQPMNLRKANLQRYWLICNGEIYNHKTLSEKYNFKTETNSDCEIIIHMFAKFGMNRTCRELDGVFALSLYDKKEGILYSARDRYGVRPSFFGASSGEYFVASEIKAMSDIAEKIQHFPPGSWWSSETPQSFYSYFDCDYKPDNNASFEEATTQIQNLLTSAVEKRMMSDREIGCLLSGGLDSSLIASLANSMTSERIKTFSIGMPGSPDVVYAQKVADWIGSDHHVVEATAQEFVDAIEAVIYSIESYDTTTVRASVGNYLVGKYIKENTDVKVVFNGDGSDEVAMGYLYNINAPSNAAFFEENLKLLREIHIYDVLRSDRSVSSHGLEARTPFLDRDFVDYYMSLPVGLKRFGGEVPEKNLLRSAFSETGLLPLDVLNRTKCAFSDAVSTRENSWHKIIQQHVNTVVSDGEFAKHGSRLHPCTPVLKESYYYRKVFEKFFGKPATLTIPKFWMPNWSDVNDPSARELTEYQEDEATKT
tara:strand:+ start:555 stop:2186 length:1632 start_codon:yes stop_codon:yes gene_type:complete